MKTNMEFLEINLLTGYSILVVSLQTSKKKEINSTKATSNKILGEFLLFNHIART